MLPQALGLLGILAGTATDIHHREVPDWLNYSMIATGLAFGLMHAVLQAAWDPLLRSLLGLIVGFAFGALMYYTGQWGGGDAKMLMGLGALIGLPLSGLLEQPPFLLVFLVLTIFAGAAYGVVWMLFLLVRDFKDIRPHLREQLKTPFARYTRIFFGMLAVVLLILALLLPMPFRLLLVLLALLLYMSSYLTAIVKSVEQVCFVKAVPVEKLVVGDWLVDEVRRGKRVVVKKTSTGLTAEQLTALEQAGVKSVRVKEGIPFVPSFLIAYVFAWYWTAYNLPLLFWL